MFGELVIFWEVVRVKNLSLIIVIHFTRQIFTVYRKLSKVTENSCGSNIERSFCLFTLVDKAMSGCVRHSVRLRPRCCFPVWIFVIRAFLWEMTTRMPWKTFSVTYRLRLGIGLARVRLRETEASPLRRGRSEPLHNSVTLDHFGHNSNGQIYW